jgi:RNA polymerase sigma-70 factor (ECF subfamily)
MAFFLRRVGNHSEAEDLTQEVFVRLARSGGAQIREADAYIFRVATNLVRDRARRERVRAEYVASFSTLDGIGIEALDPHRIAAGREALAQIMAALTELPERTRQIFLLFRYEQIDQRTIAESFGISVSAVEKHIHKAMAKLISSVGDPE